MSDRFVVLGLAHPRSAWFANVAHWSSGASIPVDFVKCVSAPEVVARFGSGREFSALVIDAGVSGIDRDLLHTSAANRCSPIVVDDARTDWRAIGACAVLPSDFGREQLLAVLREHSTPVGLVALPVEPDAPPSDAIHGPSGQLFAVTGIGGSGTSTVAMALAQGLGNHSAYGGGVVLADFALDADLAMLHNATDTVPGVQDVLESFRSGTPSDDELWRCTFAGEQHTYRVLLGLRRHRDWTVVRPSAFAVLLARLRAMSKALVCDIDADFEGESECGSLDVEDRNGMARTTAAVANVVLVTSPATARGLHGMVRTVAKLRAQEVEPRRIVPTITRSTRNPQFRASVVRTIQDLTEPLVPPGQPLGPVFFFPDLRRHEAIIRDATPMPDAVAGPLADAVLAISKAVGDPPIPSHDGVPVRIGAIGSWMSSDNGGADVG